MSKKLAAEIFPLISKVILPISLLNIAFTFPFFSNLSKKSYCLKISTKGLYSYYFIIIKNEKF